MIIMLINKLYIILRVHFDSGDMLSIIIIYVYILQLGKYMGIIMDDP